MGEGGDSRRRVEGLLSILVCQRLPRVLGHVCCQRHGQHTWLEWAPPAPASFPLIDAPSLSCYRTRYLHSLQHLN